MREIRSFPGPYSVRMQGNTAQKNTFHAVQGKEILKMYYQSIKFHDCIICLLVTLKGAFLRFRFSKEDRP